MQRTYYCKETDDYDIEDEYGGCGLNLKETKQFIEVVRKTHPELLEKPKERTFNKQMEYYDTEISRLITLAINSCGRIIIGGECPAPRKKCPFKVNSGEGEYYCRLSVIEEATL